MSDEALVEDLGDGNWLIKPTGEIRECSRSTAYRRASKALKEMNGNDMVEQTEVEHASDETLVDEPAEEQDVSPRVDPPEISTDEIEIEWDSAKAEIPVFDLPTIEEFEEGGDGDEIPDSFQEGETEDSDEGFIDAFKRAKVIQDDEGNTKIHLGDLLIGDNPLVYAILGSCDSALYDWMQNKHGIELWDPESRKIQRNFFVKILAVVAPKTSIQLDPTMMLVVMIGWLYGVPMLKIVRASRSKVVKINVVDPYEEEGEVYDE
mgnify:CR=1 FL=1